MLGNTRSAGLEAPEARRYGRLGVPPLLFSQILNFLWEVGVPQLVSRSGGVAIGLLGVSLEQYAGGFWQERPTVFTSALSAAAVLYDT